MGNGECGMGNGEWGMRNVRVDGVPRTIFHCHSAFRTPHSALERGPVTFLELLPAAAGARVVATDVGVWIRRGDARTRGRGTGSRRRLAAHEAIRGRLARHHRCGAARRRPPPSYETAERPTTGRPGRRPAPWRGWRPDFDLELEPPLRECRMEIMHQADEHVVGLVLVFDQG